MVSNVFFPSPPDTPPCFFMQIMNESFCTCIICIPGIRVSNIEIQSCRLICLLIGIYISNSIIVRVRLDGRVVFWHNLRIIVQSPDYQAISGSSSNLRRVLTTVECIQTAEPHPNRCILLLCSPNPSNHGSCLEYLKTAPDKIMLHCNLEAVALTSQSAAILWYYVPDTWYVLLLL